MIVYSIYFRITMLISFHHCWEFVRSISIDIVFIVFITLSYFIQLIIHTLHINMISIWYSEPHPRSVDPPAIRFPLSGHPSFILAPSPIMLGVRVCIKSPTLDARWHEEVFISGGNYHLKSQFCRIELGPNPKF
jgi:hypothetical protein